MLVTHALKLGYEFAEVVNVCGKAQDNGRQGTRLPAIFLVYRVEVVVEFGMVGKHSLVEDACYPLAVLFESGDGVLDQLGLLVCKSHDCWQVSGRLFLWEALVWWSSNGNGRDGERQSQ